MTHHISLAHSSRRGADREAHVLPCRADEGGLGVVRRIPGANAELEPTLGVDRHLSRPEAPGVVMLRSEYTYMSADAFSAVAPRNSPSLSYCLDPRGTKRDHCGRSAVRRRSL